MIARNRATRRGAGDGDWAACPTGYNVTVEKRARVFARFEDAERADARDDAALSHEERLNTLIELRDRRHPDAAEQRLARVYRVVELERS